MTTPAADEGRFVLIDGLGGQWLAVETGAHNCAGGTMESNGAHEPHCGLDPIGRVVDLLDEATRRQSVIAEQQARPVPPPHPSTMAGRLPPSEQTCPGGC